LVHEREFFARSIRVDHCPQEIGRLGDRVRIVTSPCDREPTQVSVIPSIEFEQQFELLLPSQRFHFGQHATHNERTRAPERLQDVPRLVCNSGEQAEGLAPASDGGPVEFLCAGKPFLSCPVDRVPPPTGIRGIDDAGSCIRQ
jgi:hypothetical protein